MMSESNRPAEPPDEAAAAAAGDSTDDLEGSYTEVDGDGPHERTVAGAYIRTDGADDDETSVSDYTSSEGHPDSHEPAERHGKFVRTEPPKPHPGLHHA